MWPFSLDPNLFPTITSSFNNIEEINTKWACSFHDFNVVFENTSGLINQDKTIAISIGMPTIAAITFYKFIGIH